MSVVALLLAVMAAWADAQLRVQVFDFTEAKLREWAVPAQLAEGYGPPPSLDVFNNDVAVNTPYAGQVLFLYDQLGNLQTMYGPGVNGSGARFDENGTLFTSGSSFRLRPFPITKLEEHETALLSGVGAWGAGYFINLRSDRRYHSNYPPYIGKKNVFDPFKPTTFRVLPSKGTILVTSFPFATYEYDIAGFNYKRTVTGKNAYATAFRTETNELYILMDDVKVYNYDTLTEKRAFGSFGQPCDIAIDNVNQLIYVLDIKKNP